MVTDCILLVFSKAITISLCCHSHFIDPLFFYSYNVLWEWLVKTDYGFAQQMNKQAGQFINKYLLKRLRLDPTKPLQVTNCILPVNSPNIQETSLESNLYKNFSVKFLFEYTWPIFKLFYHSIPSFIFLYKVFHSFIHSIPTISRWIIIYRSSFIPNLES